MSKHECPREVKTKIDELKGERRAMLNSHRKLKAAERHRLAELEEDLNELEDLTMDSRINWHVQ